ncbi:MAG: DUF58 domain-containing protein [Nanoarchaeota archaeon]|nr:DUF58 domain-containing protein [Nanoarchaeota archaeon]MBU1320774.1 DUF58 domain-containing protein [Nanoarchaeota archaeon]MBU1598141.1 DUF58 domain-containing protein [Nanoarchaeota archaeon]MBU2442202.1 DUF58 domain-containing protein [Nanoarchaeota archaeon]
MIDITFLKELDRFNIVLKKRVLSRYQGERQSHAQGHGLVFSDYKDYVPGDDFRNIDWRVYARTDKFFVKQFEEERNMTVHVIIDASASMDYGRKISKFEYASMIGLGFSYMALRNNEKFNISTFSEGLNYIKARKGMNQLMGIVDRLEKLKVKGKSEFQKSFDEYKKYMRSKSFVVVISDFLYDIEEIKRVLSRFTMHEVVVIQVLDPQERRLALYGDVILEDSEMHTKLRTFISNRLINNYRDKIEHHIHAIKDACEHMGHDFISITTDRPIFETFYAALRT